MGNSKNNATPTDLNDQMQVRRDKMNKLQEQGIAPFGHRFDRTDNSQSLIEKYDKYDKEELMEDKHNVVDEGRIHGKRGRGHDGFINLLESTGVVLGDDRQGALCE